MFATDHGGVVGEKSDEERADWLGWVRDSYLEQQKFYETDEVIEIGRRSRGIALPDAVVEKIYRTNAERWYPGLNP